MPDKGALITLAEAIQEYGPEILKNLVKTQSFGPLSFGRGAWVTRPSLPDGIYAIRGSTDKTPSLIGLMIPAFGQPAPFSAAVYQTILTVTVGTGKTGYLQEISIFSNKPLTTQWRITVIGSQKMNNQLAQTVVTWRWQNQNGKGLELPAGSQILIEAKSDGAVTTTATGMVTGTLEG